MDAVIAIEERKGTSHGRHVTASERPAGGTGRAKRWLGLTGFGLFTLVVSLVFYVDGKGAAWSSLSGDQINILTICAKLDHPELLEDDLVVGDVRNVSYYIPFFVAAVRVCSGADHDYLRGLNILLGITSLFYLWGWFLLLRTWSGTWVAAALAFLVRGIMWPPGNELWGIAGLWSMLPRTLLLALIPWVLWAWVAGRGHWGKLLLAGVGAGALSNAHPVGGAGLAAALVVAELAWSVAESKRLGRSLGRCLVFALAMGVGMAPYVYIYLTRVAGAEVEDAAGLRDAILMRISDALLGPRQYLVSWLTPKWLALLLGPWAAVLLLRRDLRGDRGLLWAMGGFSAGCVLAAILPFGVETVMERLGGHGRFAFQLVRVGKFILIPTVVLTAIAAGAGARRLCAHWRHGGRAIAVACLLSLMLTVISRHRAFDRVPFLGDDICRFLWPHWVFPAGEAPASDVALDRVMNWIQEFTPEDAKFVGPRLIRPAALRAVIHDWSGAVLLIEGNPGAFVATADRESRLNAIEERPPEETARVLNEWGADYWVTTTEAWKLPVAFTSGPWWVYDLNEFAR
jgi:hypothetical protein